MHPRGGSKVRDALTEPRRFVECELDELIVHVDDYLSRIEKPQQN